MYQVYTLADPRDTGIRYVGLSKNAYKRYAMHLLIPSKKRTEKDVWVKELLDMDTAPTLKIIETVETKQQAEDREQYWIHYYLQIKTNLLNVAKTGYMPKQIRRTHTVVSGVEINMNVETVKKIITDTGWSPVERTRRKGTPYLYARKRAGSQIEERYIAPLSKLATMSEQEILAKLNRQ